MGYTAAAHEVSLRDHCPDVYNQGGTNSCVAQAFAGGIQVAEKFRGIDSVTPSRLFMYANSRLLHGAIRFDFGTYLRHCAKMLNRLGVPNEQHWKWSTNSMHINRRPSWAASMRAHPRMGGKYHRIFDTGDDRIMAIRASIQAGLPVAFGMQVRESFLSGDGPSVIRNETVNGDDIVGGHAMLIVGYKNSYEHGPVFQVRNSWGPGWRDRGYCWLTRDMVETLARDLWVIHGWNNWTGTASKM